MDSPEEPTSLIDEKLANKVIKEIIKPTLYELKKRGIFYSGFLYAGLMIDKNKNPYVLEYNCRLGDPEAQAILMRLESDIVELFLSTVDNELEKIKILPTIKQLMIIYTALMLCLIT